MAEITITGWTTRDVRFPTSLDKTGSDAMNLACDYSAAYCILQTDSPYTGHGMVCTYLYAPTQPLRARLVN
jgi:L-galactonate dehydratase